MNNQDIRWQQRLQNFEKALALLSEAVVLSEQRPLTELEEQGLIQRFEFTHELAWNVLKDYAEYQGVVTITGSRDATREGVHMGLIQNGDVWMEMLKSRNQSSHTYNEDISEAILKRVIDVYHPLFEELLKKMKSLPV